LSFSLSAPWQKFLYKWENWMATTAASIPWKIFPNQRNIYFHFIAGSTHPIPFHDRNVSFYPRTTRIPWQKNSLSSTGGKIYSVSWQKISSNPLAEISTLIPRQDFCRCLDVHPPTLWPLMTLTQTLKPQNFTTQKRFDHVTLSPKCERIVCPTKYVTLRPQKVSCSVTAEHYDPVVFLVSTVCDIMSQIPPTSLAFSSLMLASGRFLIVQHC
jgi:hypothetical protein